MRLMEENQFDTIYHEHFSYFSLLSTERIFAAHGLTLFDVEEISDARRVAAHLCAAREDDVTAGRTPGSARSWRASRRAGLNRPRDLWRVRRAGEGDQTQAAGVSHRAPSGRESPSSGYGAPGKGNTLLNYCGIRTDFLDYTVDRNPYKHGKFLPGTHIPIFPPERIRETRPDYVLILPWNLKDEIMEQLMRHPRVGRPVRRADSGACKVYRVHGPTRKGRRAVKVVLFCGGHGDAATRTLGGAARSRSSLSDTADHLARHEVLRPFRPEGLHPLPGLSRRP